MPPVTEVGVGVLLELDEEFEEELVDELDEELVEVLFFLVLVVLVFLPLASVVSTTSTLSAEVEAIVAMVVGTLLAPAPAAPWVTP